MGIAPTGSRYRSISAGGQVRVVETLAAPVGEAASVEPVIAPLPRRQIPLGAITDAVEVSLAPNDVVVSVTLTLVTDSQLTFLFIPSPVIVVIEVLQDDTGGYNLSLPQVQGPAAQISTDPGARSWVDLISVSGNSFHLVSPSGPSSAAPATVTEIVAEDVS